MLTTILGNETLAFFCLFLGTMLFRESHDNEESEIVKHDAPEKACRSDAFRISTTSVDDASDAWNAFFFQIAVAVWSVILAALISPLLVDIRFNDTRMILFDSRTTLWIAMILASLFQRLPPEFRDLGLWTLLAALVADFGAFSPRVFLIGLMEFIPDEGLINLIFLLFPLFCVISQDAPSASRNSNEATSLKEMAGNATGFFKTRRFLDPRCLGIVLFHQLLGVFSGTLCWLGARLWQKYDKMNFIKVIIISLIGAIALTGFKKTAVLERQFAVPIISFIFAFSGFLPILIGRKICVGRESAT